MWLVGTIYGPYDLTNKEIASISTIKTQPQL
jgi:hypothetical protein